MASAHVCAELGACGGRAHDAREHPSPWRVGGVSVVETGGARWGAVGRGRGQSTGHPVLVAALLDPPCPLGLILPRVRKGAEGPGRAARPGKRRGIVPCGASVRG